MGMQTTSTGAPCPMAMNGSATIPGAVQQVPGGSALPRTLPPGVSPSTALPSTVTSPAVAKAPAADARTGAAATDYAGKLKAATTFDAKNAVFFDAAKREPSKRAELWKTYFASLAPTDQKRVLAFFAAGSGAKGTGAKGAPTAPASARARTSPTAPRTRVTQAPRSRSTSATPRPRPTTSSRPTRQQPTKTSTRPQAPPPVTSYRPADISIPGRLAPGEGPGDNTRGNIFEIFGLPK
ncbi:MAG: hypothetical protein JWM98_3172 [Thermoleophilia bacterium]|nr:hypothetical protein [Thermoleophilia bacterium]